MIPKQNDPFWIQNGTLPIRFEKLPMQIYAVHQGDVTVYLSLEEIDDLIELVYGADVSVHTNAKKEKMLDRDSWIQAQKQEPDH